MCSLHVTQLFHSEGTKYANMSATLVETSSASQPGSLTLTHTGAYKEIAPTSFSEDDERKGTESAPPASYPHYLPVWDEKTK